MKHFFLQTSITFFVNNCIWDLMSTAKRMVCRIAQSCRQKSLKAVVVRRACKFQHLQQQQVLCFNLAGLITSKIKRLFSLYAAAEIAKVFFKLSHSAAEATAAAATGVTFSVVFDRGKKERKKFLQKRKNKQQFNRL
jgi:hypothetical protein